MLIGIVGKPSSGKSTFLNAACLTQAKTANYPFTTIDPNLGKSFVKTKCVCAEFSIKDNPKNSICTEGARFIPIKLLDVAGLVPGAHTGRGMGNKFLADLSRADVLIHVVDISGSLDEEGQDIEEGARNPLEDIKFLEKEINFWFRDILIRKDWPKFVRKIEQEKLGFADMLFERMTGISVKRDQIIAAMYKSKNLNFKQLTSWSDEMILDFASTLREISKPIIIAANKVDKASSTQLFHELEQSLDTTIIPCSALAEFWLRHLHEKKIIQYSPGDAKFIIHESNKLTAKENHSLKDIQEKILNTYQSTGIQEILNFAVFSVLQQIVVYPVYDMANFSDKDGNVFPDAHLVKKGTHLKDFVNVKIHSDLAKNFIYGLDARTKMRLGENYELKNNDIVKIVSATKSK